MRSGEFGRFGAELSPGECQIWIASIGEFAEYQAALDGVLTPDEQAHVRRIGGDRATARLSRGLLRLILARHLDLPHAEIEIDRTCPHCARAHGRPRLPRRPGTAVDATEFSVSHGGDLLVLALTVNAPVGVDVEPIGDRDDVSMELLDFTLTDPERLRLLEAPAAQQRTIFLRHWTGKEAILKALGTGLDVEPQTVSLPLFSFPGKVSVSLPGSPPADLWISDVEVGPAHVCTLATGHEVGELRPARLSPSFLLDRRG